MKPTHWMIGYKPISEGNMSKKSTNFNYKIIRKIRGDQSNINPVTKIIPNKNPKTKHKGKEYDYE